MYKLRNLSIDELTSIDHQLTSPLSLLSISGSQYFVNVLLDMRT